MTLEHILSKYKPAIDRRSVSLIARHRALFSQAGSFGDSVVEEVSQRIVKGKTIRGSLFLYAAETFGVRRISTLLDCAAALEIIQMGILVHDDIMDQDEIRRGMPTLHAGYATDMSRHAAESLAINIGDILFFMAEDCILKSPIDHKKKTELLSHVNRTIMQTGIAQMDDVYFAQKEDAFLSEKDILTLYTYKTAHYTFTAPLAGGAIMAGKKRMIPALTQLGKLLGLMFQIRDDMLDIYGDEKKTGKPRGSDVRENKKTILHALLFSKAGRKDRKVLSSFFGKKCVSSHDIENIKILLKTYKIDRHIQNKISRYAVRARAISSSLPIEKEAKETLFDLVEFVSAREK